MEPRIFRIASDLGRLVAWHLRPQRSAARMPSMTCPMATATASSSPHRKYAVNTLTMGRRWRRW